MVPISCKSCEPYLGQSKEKNLSEELPYVLGWVAQGVLAVGQEQPQPSGLTVWLVGERCLQSQLQDHQQALRRPQGTEHGAVSAGFGSSGGHTGISSVWQKPPGQVPCFSWICLGAGGWTTWPPRVPSNVNYSVSLNTGLFFANGNCTFFLCWCLFPQVQIYTGLNTHICICQTRCCTNVSVAV